MPVPAALFWRLLFLLCIFTPVFIITMATPSSPLYSFWYSSLPSSFLDSATLRTALLKSSWLIASL